jgi:hypothetical protein
MRMNRAAVALVSFLALACGGKQTTPAENPKSVRVAGVESTNAVAETPTEDGGVVSVRLLSPGAEPRSPLRLAFTLGATETMVMAMQMKTTTTVAGGDQTMKYPLMIEHLRMKVTEVKPNGSARIDFVIERANAKEVSGVPPMVVSAVDQALQGMVGMKGYTVITDRGVVEAGDVEVANDAPPTVREMATKMRESLTQFASPVPVEPVGVGAVWEVTSHPTAGGVKVTQKARQKLVSRKGSQIQTEATVKSIGAPQEMHSDKLPPGARADVQSLEVRGAGIANWGLDHLVPDRSEVKVRSELNATLRMADDSVPMKAQAEIEIALTRAP